MLYSREKMSSGEFKFVSLVMIIVLTITSLPYMFAVLSAPPERHFMGFILNISDHAQYLSWYKAFQTQYLITNQLTSEPNPPIFFNLLWWLLGRFGLYSGLDYSMVYQIFRWLACAFFMVMVYGLVSEIFPNVSNRRMAFLVIVLGSGLGWVLVVMKYTITGGELIFPLDVYIAEGNSFLSMLAYPHFAEAAGLILAVFWLLLVGERTGEIRYAIYAGLIALWLGWQHTYDLLIIWGIPAAYAIIQWLLDRRLFSYWFRALAIVGLLSWPPALYAVLLTRLNSLWKEVLAQFANAGVYTPTPPHMLILMGVPLIMAILFFLHQLSSWWKRRELLQTSSRHLIFLYTWFLVGWGLCYLPTDFQIHMINSWQVPVGLLATLGFLDLLLPKFNSLRVKFAPQLVMGLVVMLIVPTNIYLLVWRFVDLNRHNYPYYLYQGEYQALKWLENNAPIDAVILSAMEVGQFIPGISGKKAFLGHWAQTVNFYTKRDVVREFFNSNTSEERRRDILGNYKIDYVFWGMAEQELGQYIPDNSSFLIKVYESDQARIYAVSDLLAENP